jgi:F-type H+-transporting ATPase subunit b
MGQMLRDLGIEPAGLLINAVSFVLLIALMKRYLFGPVSAFLEQRRQRVTEMLDRAEEDRAAAAAERAEVEESRAELLEQAHREAEALRQAATGEAEQIRGQAREQAREMERLAREQTEREAQQAAQELLRETNRTAAAMARRLLEASLTEERHRALMEQFIADVERLAAGQQGTP